MFDAVEEYYMQGDHFLVFYMLQEICFKENIDACGEESFVFNTT